MADYVTLLGIKGGPALCPRSNLPASILFGINDKNF